MSFLFAGMPTRLRSAILRPEPGVTVHPKITEQVESRLSRSGIRYTRGRRKVVESLAKADGPRSVSDLYGDLDQDLPLSSLYRSLSVLTEVEVLTPHHGDGRVVRYELAEWLMGHHHHLRCDSCGTIDDIKLSSEAEAILENLVGLATRRHGFVATGHTLEIAGVCVTCSPSRNHEPERIDE